MINLIILSFLCSLFCIHFFNKKTCWGLNIKMFTIIKFILINKPSVSCLVKELCKTILCIFLDSHRICRKNICFKYFQNNGGVQFWKDCFNSSWYCRTYLPVLRMSFLVTIFRSVIWKLIAMTGNYCRQSHSYNWPTSFNFPVGCL